MAKIVENDNRRTKKTNTFIEDIFYEKCRNCGYSNFDISTHCQKCNNPLVSNIVADAMAEFDVSERRAEPTCSYHTDTNDVRRTNPSATVFSCRANARDNRDLVAATKVFLIIAAVSALLSFGSMLALWIVSLVASDSFGAIFFLSLGVAALFGSIFSIFMTVSYSNKISNYGYVSIRFKLVTLFFVSFVAGILMLCDSNR